MWQLGRLYLFFILLKFTIAENYHYNDNFKESLTIKPLSDGKLLTHFQFNVRTSDIKEGKAFNHYKFFPRAIGQIIQSYNARELHLTFTQGRWNYEDWGYPIVPSAGTGVELWAWLRKDGKLDKNWRSLTNALAGLFCASLNFIDDTITVQPKLSFRPEGSYNATELFARAELRYGSLPHENVCTENLTPWIKLLPCKSTSGIASLLNGHKLYDSNFHSMSIHVRPVCQDLECLNKQLEIVQTVSAVVDPVRNSGKRDWSLNQIFGKKISQACPLAEESKLEVLLSENADYKLIPDTDDVIHKSGGTIIALYNLKNLQLETDISMTWNEDVFKYNLNFKQPHVYAHRFFTGYGQERGGIKVNIFNKSTNITMPIVYYDVIPWFLKLYLHTLRVKVQINGKEVQDIDSPIKDLYYQPAVDRSRPNVIEAELLLPPNSITTLSINFDKVFLKYTEHPPDANRGFDIGSAVISSINEDFNYLHDVMTRNCSKDIPRAACHHFSIRVYTETLLVSLPTPDFSMPYNVITLTCTVIALFFGSMFNLLTRDFVALQPDDGKKNKDKNI